MTANAKTIQRLTDDMLFRALTRVRHLGHEATMSVFDSRMVGWYCAYRDAMPDSTRLLEAATERESALFNGVRLCECVTCRKLKLQ